MKNSFEIRGEVTAIFLRRKNGATIETLIDTIDLPRAQEFPMTWYAHWHNDTKSFYVYGNTPVKEGKRTIVTLHRWLLNPPKHLVIDHINHDTLDNRQINLRAITNLENQQNRHGAYRNNKKSQFRGVHWHNGNRKWRAQITLNGQLIHLGCFDDIHLAAKAAAEARSELMPYSKDANLRMVR